MYTKEVIILAVEDLRHLTNVEMFGIISMEACVHPSLRDCLFSLINFHVVRCDPDCKSVTMCNDDYEVEFLPAGKNGMNILFHAKQDLHFLDDFGNTATFVRRYWNIDQILDNLEHFEEDVKNE